MRGYIFPLIKMNSLSRIVLKVIKTLHRKQKFGFHCYIAYPEHRVETLNMVQTCRDACLLLLQNDDFLYAMVILQIDDSVIIGLGKSLRRKDEIGMAFLSKPRKRLREEQTTGNGDNLSLTRDKRILDNKQRYVLEVILPTTEEAFRS